MDFVRVVTRVTEGAKYKKSGGWGYPGTLPGYKCKKARVPARVVVYFRRLLESTLELAIKATEVGQQEHRPAMK